MPFAWPDSTATPIECCFEITWITNPYLWTERHTFPDLARSWQCWKRAARRGAARCRQPPRGVPSQHHGGPRATARPPSAAHPPSLRHQSRQFQEMTLSKNFLPFSCRCLSRGDTDAKTLTAQCLRSTENCEVYLPYIISIYT